MESIAIPFFAERSTLPSPLPSQNAIHNSKDYFLDRGDRTVVAVGKNYVVKYGRSVDLLEGENMLFLQNQSIDVRVPQVYALYKDAKEGKNYIVMERINGETLLSGWSSLEYDRKSAICSKIKQHLQSIRSIQSPGVYCSIGKRPLSDEAFYNGVSGVESTAGPFETEEELNAAMIKTYVTAFTEYSPFDPKNKAQFYEFAFPFVLRNHASVFTHGDVQRKNIMITARTGADDDFEIVFLDWELSGFYPSYWEYSLAMMACGKWNDDWSLWVNKILEPFLTEWAWIRMLRNDCFA